MEPTNDNESADAIPVEIPADVGRAVDVFRNDQKIVPSRPEAVGLILRDWLECNGYLTPK